MTESQLTKRIREYLTSQGWFVWKQHGGPMQMAGLPDLFALRDGQLRCIEVKLPGKKLTKLQERRRDELLEHGATYIIATSMEPFE